MEEKTIKHSSLGKKKKRKAKKAKNNKDKKRKIGKFFVYALEVLLILTFGGLIFFTKDDLLNIVPGYYEDGQYKDIMASKNDISVENSKLLSQNETLKDEITELGVTSSEITTKIEKLQSIEQNLLSVQENMEDLDNYNEKLSKLRVPREASQYILLSSELDDVRSEMIDLSYSISVANVHLEEFNLSIAKFKECKDSGVRWSGTDAQIAEDLGKCVTHIDNAQAKVTEMETEYDVELEETTGYLTLLKEEWNAYVGFYNAAASGDGAKMNSYDSTIQEKLNAINELDVPLVLGEFSREVIEPMETDFEGLSEVEAEKADEWGDWYETNIE